MISADTALRFVKGIGPRRAETLAARGYESVEDLLYHLPFRYEDRRRFATISGLRPGVAAVTLRGEVLSSRLIRTRRKGFTLFRAEVGDESGSILCIWYNQPYLVRTLVAGRSLVLFGEVTLDRSRRPVLENPDYELIDEGDESVHTGRIVPVYRKLGELASRGLRRIMHQLLKELVPTSLSETVPAEIARGHGFPGRLEALRSVHFPESESAAETLTGNDSPAHRALAFEETFLLQLALALRRRVLKDERRGIRYEISDLLRTRLAELLPFKLTAAQKRVLKEIGDDLRAPHPMHRLLQGDVGSGKTVVALMTLLVAIDNGYQAALMAPTEILAEQHLRNISALLTAGGVECRIGLLTGSQTAPQRREALSRIKCGEYSLVIGTHALFESAVEFHRLGLVVVDEQHRFGVRQRIALTEKGARPDVLVMTATPIPRSLALTLYGDLDLSVIDELPPGRQPVRTAIRGESDRERVYRFVEQEIATGRQVYVVLPLVEESSRSELKSATAQQEVLARRFPRLEIGLLHGRMKGPEKEQVMRRFVAGEIPILVATTVIEVGVDVANASVMLIEHAERFGLSQLHQLRGRVGRGAAASYCILMTDGEGGSRIARERLAVMEQTADGFEIAQRDLELRGPGAVFGTQQHGLSDLQFLAVTLQKPGLLDRAREAARQLVEQRPGGRARAAALIASLRHGWQKRLELTRSG